MEYPRETEVAQRRAYMIVGLCADGWQILLPTGTPIHQLLHHPTECCCCRSLGRGLMARATELKEVSRSILAFR